MSQGEDSTASQESRPSACGKGAFSTAQRAEGNDASHGRGLMNEAVKIGSYEDDDYYGNDPRTFIKSAGWNGFFEWNDLK